MLKTFALIIVGAEIFCKENTLQNREYSEFHYRSRPTLFQMASDSRSSKKDEKGDHSVELKFAERGENEKIWLSKYLIQETLKKKIRWDNAFEWYLNTCRKNKIRTANQLILKKNNSKEEKNQAYETLLANVSCLKYVNFRPIEFKLPPIIDGQPELYKPMNCSLIRTEEGYCVLCRTVNYILTSDGDYNCCDWKFRQRNFILHYDSSYQLISQHEMIEDLPRKREFWINVEGIEDCRIFTFENRMWFVGTTLDTNPFHERQISLGRLGEYTSQGTILVDKLIPLKGPDPKRCEKNWMPIVFGDHLQLIYSFDPLIVLQPELETGECRTVTKNQPLHDFSQLRGSAPPIAFDEGYLMIVHETRFADPHSPQPHKRFYVHRLAYLDQECSIKKLSLPFTFKHLGVEFCTGCALDHSGNNLVIGVSIEDKESWFCIVDLESIRCMLEPLPE